jgi:hypothetical protein
MRFFQFILLLAVSLPIFAAEDEQEIFLGINTADVREDTSSVQFLNLFRSAIPLNETVPWASKKEVTYDENGWPNDLKGKQAGTKFLNRLPEDTVEDGFFMVLYDGEGEMFYGNDARLVVHRPNKDIIEIRAGKDKILNASLFIKKSNPENYVRNIRILPEGGVCKGVEHIRVKSPKDCAEDEYLSFEENHLNPWAKEQREKLAKELEDKKEAGIDKKKDQDKKVTKEESKEESKEDKKNKAEIAEVKIDSKKKDEAKDIKLTDKKSSETKIAKTEEKDKSDKTPKENEVKKDKANKEDAVTDKADKVNEIGKDKDKDTFVIKGFSDPSKALLFNPEYLNFMKDFQMVRYMNMSGMTRNSVVDWGKRNTMKKATWGGKYGSRGAPVEVMVALSNQIDAYPWFSMPYKASDDYITKFGEYVNENLKPKLKAYIEYSNEVWNPIFIHHDYAIAEGMKQKLDKKKSQAGYKWYSKRSVQTFKLWEDVFGSTDRLIRVMGSWASNQIMSSTVLKYKDAYKHTDALAIGPYFSAHPRVLRRTKTVDDVFKATLDKKTKWGMESTVNYIKKQAKVAKSYGVDLVAYEGGQHLVDWNTRKVDEHPNQLLYAANRDPRMGILYDEMMNEWQRAGGKLFVAFSAPRIYSWYGSWGIKEHIRQARSDAPKYDSLMRYLSSRLYPKQLPQPGINQQEISDMGGIVKNIKSPYAKTPQMIWDMSHQQQIKTGLKDNNPRDIDAHWQANWDTKNLYISFAINDDDIQTGDEITLTLDTTSAAEDLEKEKKQEKLDIANEKALLKKQKKAKALRKIEYERIAKEKKEKVAALANKETNTESIKEAKAKEDAEKAKLDKKSNEKTIVKKVEKKTVDMSKVKDSTKADNKDKKDVNKEEKPVTKDDKAVSNDEKAVKTSEKETKSVVSAIEAEMKKASKSTKDKLVKKEEKVTETKSENPKDKSENKEVKEEDTETANIETTKETVAEIETDSEEGVKQEPGLKKSFAENVITFTLTPLDELNKQSRITLSDSGYLINVAIPWSEIYYETDMADIQMKSGDRLGINIVVKDYDIDEKGNKELISADTSLPLPKLILKNTLFE